MQEIIEVIENIQLIEIFDELDLLDGREDAQSKLIRELQMTELRKRKKMSAKRHLFFFEKIEKRACHFHHIGVYYI